MRKKLLLLVSFCLGITAMSGQIASPNGNFESWTSGTFEYPQYYPYNSNPQTFFQCHTPFNVTKTTDAYHGSFALMMTTNSLGTDTCMGYIANTNVQSGAGPTAWTGGMAFNQKPTGIRGYYKYNVASGDSALIIVICKLAGTTIGGYTFTLGGIHSTYTLFNLPFSPALPLTPDSIIVAMASSNALSNIALPGSTFQLDSLSFTGVTAQPAAMNGDFESWLSQTVTSPDSWYIDNGDGNGVVKTTDMYAGSFAVELQTYLGDNNGTPRARGGMISTGWWDQSCSCQRGGYPFINQIDTLQFYYKYAPTISTDSAWIQLQFKNGGTVMGGAGKSLHPAASYQYGAIGFNLGSVPDSVIITIQSSSWADSATSFVGASLKVDELHFKSEMLTTGLSATSQQDDVVFYPNPFRTTGTIRIADNVNTDGLQVILFDAMGREVRKTVTSDHKITIDRNDLKNGIYFYELRTADKLIKKGKMIIE